VVAVGDDAMVKVIDIDLERRRISLSLKQANEDYTEEFDPAKYGMSDSYDESGNYIFPEGFDSETNEWLEGFDKQRSEWEARYGEAERRHKMHTAQMERFAAAEAAAAEERPTSSSTSTSTESGEESAGGSLASDAQLTALREKLAGNA
jgi:small subunit ribosomal protein S1